MAVFSSNKPDSRRLRFAAQVMSTISELTAYTVMDKFKRFGYSPTVDVIKEKMVQIRIRYLLVFTQIGLSPRMR